MVRFSLSCQACSAPSLRFSVLTLAIKPNPRTWRLYALVHLCAFSKTIPAHTHAHTHTHTHTRDVWLFLASTHACTCGEARTCKLETRTHQVAYNFISLTRFSTVREKEFVKNFCKQKIHSVLSEYQRRYTSIKSQTPLPTNKSHTQSANWFALHEVDKC